VTRGGVTMLGRPPRSAPTRAPLRRPAGIALAGWVAVVLTVTLWPEHVDRDAAPLLRRVLAGLQEIGLPAWVTYERIELGANVAMLLPFGLLIVLVLGRRHVVACLLAGPVLSAAVELVQLLMPHRTSSMLDVVANGLGASIGVALGCTLEAVVGRRERRAAESSRRRILARVRSSVGDSPPSAHP
jgi:glycopeptide antibiotics resistance protein